MPFPKVKFCHCVPGGSSPRLKLITDPDSGIVTESVVPNNSPLPDRKYNKIGNLVKAGVMLKEVTTKVVVNTTPDEVNKYVDAVFTALPKSKDDSKNSNKKDDE